MTNHLLSEENVSRPAKILACKLCNPISKMFCGEFFPYLFNLFGDTREVKSKIRAPHLLLNHRCGHPVGHEPLCKNRIDSVSSYIKYCRHRDRKRQGTLYASATLILGRQKRAAVSVGLFKTFDGCNVAVYS